jgi:poly(ADP-ribose) glycohydrolase ARH3
MSGAAAEPDRLRSKLRGALLGCFVGDALGRPYEGASVDDPRLREDLRRRAVNPGALLYTDDTEMMIGLAESLVRRGALDPEDVLRTLAAEHDPARGYGKGMKLAFAALAGGAPPERVAYAAWPGGSTGNGAAVRVVPLACLHHDEPEALERLAEASAAITHAHPIGRAGCVVQALALASALRLDPAAELDRAAFAGDLARRVAAWDAGIARKLSAIEGMIAAPPPPREVVAILGNGVSADVSVPLAVFAFLAWYPSFEEVVCGAVAHGGDTDTIGAMAGALIGAAVGEGAIPERWLVRLENRARGRDHVVALADDLHALWASRSAAAHGAG